ncbi:MAG: GTP cyclohydrolase II [Sphingomonadales bacterium]
MSRHFGGDRDIDRDEHTPDNPGPGPDLESVRRAIAALRKGAPVVATDRRGDAWVAFGAEYAAADVIALMRRWRSGPPLLALTDRRATLLHIPPSGEDVILITITNDMTADTVLSLADPTADLGHPLRGPFERDGTAISDGLRGIIRMCKSAHLLPAAIAAPLPAGISAAEWADARGLAVVSADQIGQFEAAQANDLRQVADAHVPLAGAEDTRLVAFRPGAGEREHLAIIIGQPPSDEPVLVRLHSQCFTGDLLASLRCDCGDQLRGAINVIAQAGGGVVLYLDQEGRDIGLVNKLRAYHLQDDGFDTIEANERLGFEADERLFLVAAKMLRRCGFDRIRLLTNNPQKVAQLQHFGIDVVERAPHAFPTNNHNEAYLATKARRSGHYLDVGPDDD